MLRALAFPFVYVAVWLLAGCSPVLFVDHGVPNLRQVEPGLYRGGEPTAEGWRHLRDDLGVCVDVEWDFPDERPVGSAPPDGLTVVSMPMPPSDADDLFRGPTVDELRDAAQSLGLALLHARAHGCSVYGHCRWGRDRTGAVIATFRHLIEGWSKEDAFAEALRMGFHRALIGLWRSWEALP